MLLDFLKHNESEELFLVGDILDGWRLKSGWYWPQAHNDVIQKLLRKVRKGARVVFIPGNHDEFAREFLGMEFGGVEVVDHVIHETADGRRFLVVHGDQFDIVVRNARWLAHLGDWAYDFAIWANTWFNVVAPKTRPALLVLLEMGQAQGEERRQFHRRFRGDCWPARRASAASTASSAAISITRRFATSTGSPM